MPETPDRRVEADRGYLAASCNNPFVGDTSVVAVDSLSRLLAEYDRRGAALARVRAVAEATVQDPADTRIEAAQVLAALNPEDHHGDLA